MICHNDGEEAKSISVTKRYIFIKVNLNVFSVVIKDPLERKILRGGGCKSKVFRVGGMDIFWNQTMLRIGRPSRKIDFSFILPKHTLGLTFSRKNSLKFQ